MKKFCSRIWKESIEMENVTRAFPLSLSLALGVLYFLSEIYFYCILHRPPSSGVTLLGPFKAYHTLEIANKYQLNFPVHYKEEMYQ